MIYSFVDVIRADIRHSAKAQDRFVALRRLIGAGSWNMSFNRRLNHVISVQGAIVRIPHTLARMALLDAVLQTVAPARVRGVLAEIHFLGLFLDDWVKEALFLASVLPEDVVDLQCTLCGGVLQVRLRLASMAAEAVLDKVTHSHMTGVFPLASGCEFFHVAGGVSTCKLLLSAAQIHAACHSSTGEGRLSPRQLLHAVAVNLFLHFTFHEFARKIGIIVHLVK